MEASVKSKLYVPYILIMIRKLSAWLNRYQSSLLDGKMAKPLRCGTLCQLISARNQVRKVASVLYYIIMMFALLAV